ncbi:hypothetical protein OXX80_012017 [Metschnikowia pulcherrima]
MDTDKARTTHISCLEEFSIKRQADERGVCLRVSSVVATVMSVDADDDGAVCKDELTMCCLVLSWVRQLT